MLISPLMPLAPASETTRSLVTWTLNVAASIRENCPDEHPLKSDILTRLMAGCQRAAHDGASIH